MASVLPQRTQFVLDESRIPRAWYNIAADLPAPLQPAAPPGHPPADRPRRPRPAVPDGADPPGGQRRARDRDPGPGPRGVHAVPALAPAPGAPAGEGARYPGPHLLQVRGREPGRQPQAEHRDPAGVLQQAGGRHAARDRDRRGPVGERARVRGRDVRARGQGLHGPRELRPEAVPPDPHGDVRRPGRRQPQPRDELRASRPGGDAGLAGLARHGDLARPSRTPRRATTRSTRWAPCSTTCCCTRPSSGSRRSSRWRWPGEEPDVIIALRRRRLELRRPHLPVRRPQAARRGELPDHRRGARGGPVADPRRLRLRLRRYRPHGPDRQDAHARQRVHPRADPRRRAALPRHGAAGVAAQGARRHRRPERPPAGRVRGRRAVRADRGHPAGAGERRTRSRSRSTRPSPPRRPASRG